MYVYVCVCMCMYEWRNEWMNGCICKCMHACVLVCNVLPSVEAIPIKRVLAILPQHVDSIKQNFKQYRSWNDRLMLLLACLAVSAIVAQCCSRSSKSHGLSDLCLGAECLRDLASPPLWSPAYKTPPYLKWDLLQRSLVRGWHRASIWRPLNYMSPSGSSGFTEEPAQLRFGWWRLFAHLRMEGWSREPGQASEWQVSQVSNHAESY